MYYIWSAIITFVIFGILQYIERQKDVNNYTLYKKNNLVLLFMIYLMSTIMCYFIISDTDIVFKKENIIGGSKEVGELLNNSHVDPSVLKKIPDNINIGFEPFDDLED